MEGQRVNGWASNWITRAQEIVPHQPGHTSVHMVHLFPLFVHECSSLPPACRYVHMYELTKRFVVPWSKGTGCSVATLMGYKRTAQDAKMMLSHVRRLTLLQRSLSGVFGG